ncbi:retention module-containing protein [Azonexus hydrophilus]|uniref:Retention module-containing protein n=3 Tax=Azonexus hydrophilus TaxID=418702 RepID=A0ABZ2XLV7_9RHOO
MAQAAVIAKVSSLTGEAYARDSAGNLRRLKAGDVIREGEVVVSGNGAQVVLALADGRSMVIAERQAVTLDAEVAAQDKPDASDSAVARSGGGFDQLAGVIADGGDLDALLDAEAPAAGEAASGNEGHSFVEFLRVVESVDGQQYGFATERNAPEDTFQGGLLPEDPPGIEVSNVTVSEGQTAIFTLTLSNPSANPTTVTLNLGNTAVDTDTDATLGSDLSNDLYVTFDNGATWTPVVGGQVQVPANTTTFYVSVQTTADEPTQVYEGPETFTLTATTVTNSATGVGTITDDGTPGTPQPPVTPPTIQPPPLDDRPGVTVNNVTVSEGQTAIFTLTLSNPSANPTTVTLNLGNTAVDTDTDATLGSDLSNDLYVTFDNGATWTPVVGGQVQVPANTTTFYVSVQTTADEPTQVYEGPETFTLTATTAVNTATGTGTITDDGTPGTPLPPTVTPPTIQPPPLDDRPGVTVNNVTVSEGQTAIFTLTLSNPSENPTTVTLNLGNTAVNTDTDATLGSDLSNDLYVTFDNGATWTPVVGGQVQVPANTTTFYVSVQTTADEPTQVYEGPETFTLTATTVTNSATGVGTITDDGTPGTPQPPVTPPTIQPPPLDDRPGVTVNNVTVSEGQTAIFTLTLSNPSANPTTVTLNLGNTAVDTDTDATLGSDLSNDLYVTFDNGATWTPVVGGQVQVPANTTTFYVSVQTTADEPTQVYEGPETFTLTATTVTNSATGVGTITDDGTPGTPQPPVTPPTIQPPPLDDRPGVTVNNVTVSEGQTAIFTLTLSNPSANPTTVTLNLGNTAVDTDTDATLGSDLSNDLYVTFDNGATWTPVVGGQVQVPANTTTFYVSVQTTADEPTQVYEGPETFTLTATTVTNSATGVGTITDDGTPGTPQPPVTPPTIQPPPLDDRPGVTVNNVTVSEGQTAIFTLTLSNPSANPTTVTLNLGNTAVNTDTDATLGSDLSNDLYVTFDNGATWTPVVGGQVQVPANTTTFYVSVQTTADEPTQVYEGPETFTLTATTVTNSATGVGTITDDGTPGTPQPPVTPPTIQPPPLDDRPGVTVNNVTVSEGQTAIFTLTLSNPSANPTTVTLNLGNTAVNTDTDATLGSDLSNDLYVTFDNGATWTPVVGGQVQVPANTTTFYVSVQTTADEPTQVYEGPETFTLTATTATQATPSTGVGTITDDGTPGTPLPPTVTPPTIQPPPLDDRPGVTVNNVTVSEGQTAIFTLTLSNPSANPTTVTLNLGNTAVNTDTDATLGSDLSNDLYVTFDNGATWTPVVGGQVQVPANTTTFYVSVQTTADEPTQVYEGPETFTLTATTAVNTATGTGTITDDGTPGTPLPPTVTPPTIQPPPLDDRPGVTVNNVTVSEGQTAIFTLTLSNPSANPTTVTLNLGNTAVDTDTDATLGSDLSNDLYVTFDNGATWTPVVGGQVQVPANTTTFYVSVQTTADEPTQVYEGPETFTLTATTVTNSATGVGTITDDGTPGTPQPPVTPPTIQPPPLDDRPGVTVNNVTVSEGQTAIFTLTLSNPSANPTTVTLNLGNTAVDTDTDATLGSDLSNDLYVTFDNGATWTPVVGGQVQVPANTTTFYVSVQTTADEPTQVYEGPETFTLTATTATQATPSTGVGTITDDGTPGTPQPPVTPPTIQPPPLDDRPGVTVNNVTVSEGQTAIFTLTLSNPSENPTTVTLNLGNTAVNTDTDATLGSDLSNDLYVTFDNGATWTPVVGGQVQVPANTTTFYVSVQTTADEPTQVYEGPETFTLTATTAVNTATGTGTITDDGTPGTPLPPTVTPPTIQPPPLDDRPGVTVNNVTVSEGQTAIFTLTLSNPSANPTTVTLNLGNTAVNTDTDATLGSDLSNDLYVTFDNGATWTPVVGGQVQVPANTTTFYVSVQTTADEPTQVYEGPETFTLTATTATQATPSTGVGTITDDGTPGTPQPPVTPPTIQPPPLDDRPGVTVNNVTVSEGQTAIFTLTLSNPSANPTTVTLNLGNTAVNTDTDATLGSDLSNDLYVTFDNGATWTPVVGGQVQVPANTTTFYVSVQTTADEPTQVYEGPETFTLTATTVTNSATGVGTITDDGTPGTPQPPVTPPTIQPPPLDDRPGVTVNNVTVSEGQTAIFTLTLSNPSANPTTVTLNLGNTAVDTDTDATLGSDLSNDLYVTFDNGATWTPVVGGQVQVPANTTTFYVSVQTTADEPTQVYEGPETFTLTATTVTNSATGVGTITDDGTPGTPQPPVTPPTIQPPPLDDRPGVTVNNVTVSEGQTAIFTLTLSNPSANPTTVTLNLGNTAVDTDTDATLGSDLSNDLYVTFDNGATWTPVVGGQVQVPANTTTFYVSVQTTADEPTQVYEGPETFTLTATTATQATPSTGVGTITDDGTPGTPLPPTVTPPTIQPPPLDDRPGVTVNNVTVSEGQTAIFTLTLSNPSANPTTVTLNLGNTAVNTDTDATLGSDLSNDLYVTFDNGATWTPVVGGQVQVPANTTTFYVSVQTTADEPTQVYEGPETFTLTATTATQATPSTGVGTITDDGTPGTPLPPTVTPPTIQPPPLDDRPGVTVNNVTVSEGQTAIFTLTLSNPSANPTTVTLNLGNTAVNTDTDATLGSDLSNDLYVTFDNGATWTPVVGGQVQVPANTTTFYVSVQTTADEPTQVYEGPETFTLTATTVTNSATGVGTITDDGTPGTPQPPVTPPTIQPPPLDDRPGVTVNNVTVSEGQTAIFTLTLSNPSANPTTVTLNLGNTAVDTDTDATLGSDLSNDLYVTFDNGATWTPVVGGQVQVPANTTTFYVSVQTTADEPTQVYEGPETFTLTATTVTNSATGVGTITDDGTPGTPQPPVTPPTIQPPPLDDRPGVTVNNVTVSEGQTAIFTLTLSNPSENPTTVTLNLGNTAVNTDTDATLGSDLSNDLYVTFDNGATWTPVVGGQVQVPANTTTFYVSVQTTADEPTQVYEGPETFTLTATTAVNTATGTGTITDDGTPGTPLPPTVTPPTIQPPPLDDRPGVTVNNVTVSEGQTAIFTLTLSNPSENPTTVTLNLGNTAVNTDTDATLGSDLSNDLYVTFDNGATWTPVVGGQVQVPANTTTFYVSVQTTADEPTQVYEGPETFTLTATTVTNSATGVGTITDDGTPGTPLPPTVTPPTIQPPPLDDRPAVIAVSSPTTVEGMALDFVVTLSNESLFSTTVNLDFDDDTASLALDTTTPIEVSFDGGNNFTTVTVAADGTFSVSVPPSTTSFIVRLPTIDDGEVEQPEQLFLSAATAQNAVPVAGTGTINDNSIDDGNEAVSTQEDVSIVSGTLIANTVTAAGSVSILSFSVAGDPTVHAAGSSVTIAGRGELTINVDGSYSFVPYQDYSGPVPTVTYTVTNGMRTDTSTLDITVTPVADTPNVTIQIGNPVTNNLTINNTNAGIAGQGYTVTAYNLDGSPGTVSVVNGAGAGNVSGFGVAQASSGNDSEIGHLNGNSEKIAIAFDDPVSSATIQFAWLHSGERATYTLFDDQGNQIGQGTVAGVTDVVDSPFTVVSDNGAQIARIEFTAPRAGDDYLIHSVTFAQTKTHPLTITATPTDIDYSEEIATITVSVPAGVTLSHGTQNPDGTWTLPLTSDGPYVVTVDPVTKAVTITGLTMTTPVDMTGSMNITVTATARDGSDLADGSASIATLGIQPTIAVVSEEGLPGGSPDSVGVPDTTNSASFNGTMLIGGDGDRIISFTPPSGLTSGGQALSWTTTLVGTATVLSGSANGREILTLTMQSNGQYSLVLKGGLDHPVANIEDMLRLDFGVTVSNATNSNTSTLTLLVEDDAPTVNGLASIAGANQAGQTVLGSLPVSLSADGTDFTWRPGASSMPTLFADGQLVQTEFNDAGDVMTGFIMRAGVRENVFTLNIDLDSGGTQFRTYTELLGVSSQSSSFKNTGGNSGNLLLSDSASGLVLIDITGERNGQPANVNYSTQGISVNGGAGNWIDTAGNEKLTLNFGVDVTSAGFTLEAQGQTATMSWVAYRDGVEVARGNNVAITTNEQPLTISVANTGGLAFDQVVFTSNSGSWRPEVSSLSYINYRADISMNLGYQLTDSDLDTASGSINVTLLGRPAPTVGGASATLSEEGLVGGNIDNLGVPQDTTNATVFSGTMAVSGSGTLSLALYPPSTTVTSGGEPLQWSGVGTTNLVGSAAGSPVVSVTIASNGSYTVTLLGPVDHAQAGVEDVLSFDIGVTVSDGTVASSATLTVNVEDDSPVAGAQTRQLDVGQIDTNLMVILDVSGSMTSTSVDRLAAARTAITNLINSYDGYGDVAVKIVTFSTTAADRTSFWMTADDAKAMLSSITANGWTNYDAALAQAIQSWTSAGRILEAPAGGSLQNVAYFISDGQPNASDGNGSTLANNSNGGTNVTADSGIQPDEAAIWANFLATNEIKAFALGIGTGLTATDKAYLDPIAYDGTTGSSTEALMVPNVNTLSAVLQSTVAPIAQGNVLLGNTPGNVGADQGYLSVIQIDGRVFSWDRTANTVSVSGSGTASATFDAVTHQLNVSTAAGGLLIIDLDNGDYSYRPPFSGTGSLSETFGFTLRDFDGDTANGSVQLNVTYSQGAVTSVGTASGNTINGTAGNDILSGLAGNDTLSGGDGNDWLSGGDGDDILNGGNGNDKLVGGNGNDTLNGGAGNDLLIGGAGSDTMTGGMGADTFQWSLADRGNKGSPALDTITDFNRNEDILDLRDLLVGENHSTGIGNLANYIDITTTTSGGVTSTILRISHDGGFAGGTYSSGQESQRITLTGVNLYSEYGVANNNDAALIQQLLNNGKLIVD